MRHRRIALSFVAAVALGGATITTHTGAHASGGLTFGQSVVGGFGGEPSLVTDSNGILYDSTPSSNPSSAPPGTYRGTTDHTTGVTSWTQINSPDTSSGDTCLNTDSANSLYWCNLNGTPSTLPLQADVYKSTTASTATHAPITSCTSNCVWDYGRNAVTGGNCGTSCQPFGVDRQWVSSTIRPGNTTSDVVLMYHDFYGPSHIWVNISHDGGATFGTAQEVLSGSDFTSSAKGIAAEGYTFCNTVPANVNIVQPGLPHAGRVFVSWIASDPAQDATGCNLSQAESFHTLWVAYSDDALTTTGTPTWHPQLAMDIGTGNDASTPFVSFTLDDQGNPYFAFTSPTPNAPVATNSPLCAGYSSAGTLQGHPECSYRMWVIWSNDGGNTWDGGGGGSGNPLLSGSAASAYRASPATQNGTDVFPTIAVGDPGQVDVSYLHTDTIDPTDAEGKFEPVGCDAADTGGQANPVYPPRCKWSLNATQSLNLTSSPSSATFATPWVSNEMHYGDICNLGIACLQSVGSQPVPRDPRHLLDFNMETIDPTTGCAHIAYADDNAGTRYGDPANPSPYGDHLVSADQTSGCLTLTSGPGTVIPEAPLALLLLPAGLAAAVAVGVTGRRSRRRVTAA